MSSVGIHMPYGDLAGWAVLLSTGNSKGQDGRWRHRWELAVGYPGPFHLLTREQKDGRTVGIAGAWRHLLTGWQVRAPAVP